MPPKKKVAGLIKLQIQAGQATPAPPVGPALGQHGVNIMEFCKAYNAATESQRGNVIPVEITVYEDRSFTFVTKTPPAAKLILKAAGIEKGSGEPHKVKVAMITRDQVRSIAEQKMPDLNATDLDAAEKIDRDHLYSAIEAVRLAKETATKNYDPTVEVALRLGVDPRKADQMVRGTVNLPHGTGKTARVIVFATGDKAAEAEAAGADVVGSEDLIERIQGGFLDFDAAIATPDQMAKVGRIARILGPRGLMPNPKTGTVTPDVTKLVENYAAALDEILRAKPAAAKGRYLKKVTISTTMGPGIPVDPNRTRNLTVDEPTA